MSTNGIDTPAPTTDAADVAEQLSLLAIASVPLQFRLDERTRRAGLQHVAELRALMASLSADRHSNTTRSRRRTPETTAPTAPVGQRQIAA
jgi:hypothetical protein